MNRRVLLKKPRRGTDRVVGRDTTNRRGGWQIGGFRQPRGAYYAQVLRKRIKTRETIVVCGAGRSRTIRP